MDGFINELFFGNINPQARCFKVDGQYEKAMSVIVENEELLTKLLKDKELRLFLDIINAWDELTGITSCEFFKRGFRIGAEFTYDTFVGKS